MTIDLILREGPLGKGTYLTNEEVDSNFVNLRTGIELEKSERESSLANVQTSINNLQATIDLETTTRIAIDQNLQSQISNIQTTVENQGFVNINGDTLTGDLLFSNPGNSIESSKIVFPVGTDSATIHFISSGEGSEESGKSLSNLTISLYDEGDEGFLLRTVNGVNETFSLFYVNSNILEYKGNKIWHEGNVGQNSGLDADTLDGLHGEDFSLVGHNHFGLYYTTTEVDNKFLTYYTKSESDSLFAPIVHSHSYQPLNVTLTSISNFEGTAATGNLQRSFNGSNFEWNLVDSNLTEYTNGTITTSSISYTGIDPISVDEFHIGLYKSAKYTIQIDDGSNFHIIEFLVAHNNSIASIHDVATLKSDGNLVSHSLILQDEIVSIILTPTTSSSLTIKLFRQAIYI